MRLLSILFYIFYISIIVTIIVFNWINVAIRGGGGNLTEKDKEEELKGIKEREEGIDAMVTFNNYSWTSNDVN